MTIKQKLTTIALALLLAVVLIILTGCGTWVNATRPGASYYTDHQECMNEIGLITIGKPWGERLNDCVAAKGWVLQ